MRGWWHKNLTPIGLDIGSARLRLIQLERKADRWSVVAAATAALPADLPAQGEGRVKALAGIVRPLLADNPFKGRRVVSALPASAVTCKNLRIPCMPRDELAAAIEWEASDRLHLPLETVELQHIDAGQVRQGDDLRHEIILLAAPSALVHEHVNMLLASDLHPEAIDATPGALARCVAIGSPQDEQTPAGVMLDVGYESSKIVMVRQGQVVFFKMIEIGGKHFDQVVSQQLNLSIADARELRHSRQQPMEMEQEKPGEAALFGASKRQSVSRAIYEAQRTLASELAREVGLCLRYYSVTFRGRRPELLEFVGGESCDVHLHRVIADGIGMKVQASTLLESLDCEKLPLPGHDGGGTGPWAVATGLALRHESAAALRGAA